MEVKAIEDRLTNRIIQKCKTSSPRRQLTKRTPGSSMKQNSKQTALKYAIIHMVTRAKPSSQCRALLMMNIHITNSRQRIENILMQIRIKIELTHSMLSWVRELQDRIKILKVKLNQISHDLTIMKKVMDRMRMLQR